MMNNKKKLYEVDLYKPVQQFFIEQGYVVHGEVNDCDLTAVKEDELIIVELKLRINVELLVQATKRQKISNNVYIAIPKPNYSLYTKKWRDIYHLIRRLELGLMIVSFKGKNAKLELIHSPQPFDRRKSMQQNKRKRKAVLNEIEGRHGDFNIGGSHKTKIMTSYKENCIQIGCYLEECGPLSPKKLRSMGTGEKTLSILNQNYYGWFNRIQRGIYGITKKGQQEIKQHPELVQHYQTLMKKDIPTS